MPKNEIAFWKAGRNVLDDPKFNDEEDGSERATAFIAREFSEALSAKNISFLLGSGCSSFQREETGTWTELGIPTMAPLASEFLNDKASKPYSISSERKEFLSSELGIDLEKSEVSKNLERLLEILLSWEFVLRHQSKTKNEKGEGSAQSEAIQNNQSPSPDDHLKTVQDIINDIHRFIWEKCTGGPFSKGDETVLNIYQGFYRKLSQRDPSLSSPWIFTTNYDLFNEMAMDRNSIPYSNGFVGTVERRFNPSSFRHSLSERADLKHSKLSLVHPYYHLGKLHGSINWIEDAVGLYPIREITTFQANGKHDAMGRLMIYPTPAKQKSSLGSPYTDLFREFQTQISQPQSVLVCIGYSFGDEHVNSIIYQALAIANFRLVIFSNELEREGENEIKRLNGLNDPRIWIIGGKVGSGSGNAHYFDNVVNLFMPSAPSSEVQDAVEKVVDSLINHERSKSDEQ